jgi:dihydrofolate reductase
VSERLPLALVVAMTRQRVIGRAGTIPWDLPEDRKHFVAVTRGHAVIMGRLTWDSIGVPLRNRRNIVVTRNRALVIAGAEVVGSLTEAIALARTGDEEPRLIGGGQLYAEALPSCTRIYLTVLDEDVAGDTFFPELPSGEWDCVAEERGDRVVYQTLERRKA